MLVESCLPEGTVELGEQKDRWTLSEDPDDQKDSLWIWGLFSQPLYPFLLLTVILSQPVELPGGETIPAGKLFLQGEHRRDPDADTLLGAGTVDELLWPLLQKKARVVGHAMGGSLAAAKSTRATRSSRIDLLFG